MSKNKENRDYLPWEEPELVKKVQASLRFYKYLRENPIKETKNKKKKK
jgi:hypothetical protein